MTTNTNAIPDIGGAVAIESEALTLSKECAAIAITDQTTYERAVNYRGLCVDLVKKVTDFFEPHRKRWYDGYKATLAHRDSIIESTERDLRRINGMIAAWDKKARDEEERRRREEEINRQREEEIARQSRAVDAIDMGADEASVEAIVSEPIVTKPVTREEVQVYERSSAVSNVEKYKALVFDLKKFIKAIGKECDRNPGVLLLVVGLKPIEGGFESSALNKLAESQKTLLTIPGVRVYDASFVRSNTRRK